MRNSTNTTSHRATAPESTVGASAAEPSPIDTEVLFSRCLNNASFALALLDELEASGSQQTGKIIEHIAQGRLQAAGEEAHSLKGAAAIVGAGPVSAKAAELESAARADDLAAIEQLAGELQREMSVCMAYLPTVRDVLHRSL